MKKVIKLFLVLGLLSVGACSSLSDLNMSTAIGAGGDLYMAASINDQQLQTLGIDAAKQADSSNKVAPANNKYAKRLQKLTQKHVNEDGLKLDFKAYLNPQVNAFALPNGSIRVYSGLMDLMTDDELLFVIGHEIGHVKLGHAREKMRLAYAASAARKGAAATNTAIGSLAASELGGLVEAVINSQFSQSEEKASDDYGLAFLKKKGISTLAAASGLEKLAAQSGGEHSFLSSHPEPKARAKRMKGK